MLLELNSLLAILALATVLVGLFFLPGINTDLNLADEGYLWHGTLKVLEGKIPIRDFRAYDPGRYYWCALWMLFFGRSLLSLRAIMLVTQILALTTGMLTVYMVTANNLSTLLAGLAIIVWMHPYFKQLDILFCMLTPLLAVLLVSNPVDSQYLISGIYISACLFFGLNHGIYAAGALSLLVLLMGFTGHGLAFTDALSWYSLGLCTGFLPILVFFIFTPRLFETYWQQKVSRILNRGSSNLPLPVPRLWKQIPPHLARLNKGKQFIVKSLYSFVPFIYIAIILSAFFYQPQMSEKQWALIAIACGGLFYWHHATSRACPNHLSNSIAPFMILLGIFTNYFSYGTMTMIGIIIILFGFIYPGHALWLKRLRRSCKLKPFKVANNILWLDGNQADYIDRVSKLVNKYSKPDDFVLLLPMLLTFYPLLQRRAPVYDLFCVYPASDEEESKMIDELSSHELSFVLISNTPLDNRDDLRFSKTHPRVWQYLNDKFQILHEQEIPDDHYAFTRAK